MEAANNVLELSRSDLTLLVTPTLASISDVRHLSSYNWIEANSPTIAVPGCPPEWSNVSSSKRLAKDCGHYYIAQNNARHPDSPLEPLFRALYHAVPTFEIQSIDVVSDRRNFRNLLSFVDPQSDPYGLDAFTVKVEVVGKTALFNRDEAAVEETIKPADSRGYGRSFEKAYTKCELKNSTGHHRIISYRFGGLGIVIRHETDAYVNEGPLTKVAYDGQRHDMEDNLASMISSLALSNPNGAKTQKQPTNSSLVVREQGYSVSRESTLEIKTKNKRFPLRIADVSPQLWISQTPKLVRAHHERGIFHAPVVEDVTSEVRQWERDQEGKLKLLAAVIRRIIDAAKGCSNKKAVVRYDKSKDKLIIQTCEDAKMLPEDLYRKWDAQSEIHSTKTSKLDTQNDMPNTLDDQVKESPKHDIQKQPIMIGDTIYKRLPLHKMPSLASWCLKEWAKHPSIGTVLQHDQIPLFPIALAGVNSGWRQCFRLLGTADVGQYLTLCSTFTSLEVDVLEGKSLDQIFIDIKAGKFAGNKYGYDWDDECNGDRSLARNAAFQLVFLLLQDRQSSGSDGKNLDSRKANKLYNATLYIAGHLRTFKYKTRRAVQAVYLHCQSPSAKQQAELRKWTSDRDADESDATTSDESDLIDSDDDYFYGDGYDS